MEGKRVSMRRDHLTRRSVTVRVLPVSVQNKIDLLLQVCETIGLH